MSWRQTADFYSNLRRLLNAGFIVSEALEHSVNDAKGHYSQRALVWSQACAAGAELSSVADGESAFTRALLHAGEQSGRLPDMCLAISDFYQQCHNTRRHIIGKLAYPIFLLHFALIVPTGVFAWAGLIPWWSPFAGPLIIWTVSLIAYFLLKKQPRFLVALTIHAPLSIVSIPFFSNIACLVLEACVSSGMKYPQALEIAGGCIANAIISKKFNDCAQKIERDESEHISDAFRDASFSKTTVDLCHNGEISGQLEQALQRSAQLEGERFRSAVDWAARLFYAAVYGTAIIVAVVVIISAVGGYADMLKNPLGR